MYTSFTHNQKRLILQCVGQVYLPKLQASQPSSHLYLTQCIEHLPELLHSLIIIIFRFNATKAIQLLIIIVFYLLAHSSQEAITLACLMLTTTLLLYQLLGFGYLAYLAPLKHRLQSLVAKIANYGGYNT